VPKILINDCINELDIIGWLDDSNLLSQYRARIQYSEFRALDVKTSDAKILDLKTTYNLDLNLTYKQVIRFIGSRTLEEITPTDLIAQLLRHEPKLAEEIIKQEWRLVDKILVNDGEMVFIVLSPENKSGGFDYNVYSYDRSSGELTNNFLLQIEKFYYEREYLFSPRLNNVIYLLNEKEIIFTDFDKNSQENGVFISSIDGSNRKKISNLDISKDEEIAFVNEPFIGFLINVQEEYLPGIRRGPPFPKKPPIWAIKLVNIETKAEEKILLEATGFLRTQSDGGFDKPSFRLADFSRASNKLAYIGTTEDNICALYVLDFETKENKLIDSFPQTGNYACSSVINDVYWSI